MGSSYVEFTDKGYWTHDAFLEVLSFLLAREFDKIENKQAWQSDLIDKWTTAATVGFVGCVPSYLNTFDTHEKVQLLRATLVNIQTQLKDYPDFVTPLELNKNNVGQAGWTDLNIKRIQNIVQLTLDLIDGQLKTNASSPIDYWNVD
jgi:hypothetical protein